MQKERKMKRVKRLILKNRVYYLCFADPGRETPNEPGFVLILYTKKVKVRR